MPTPLRRSFDYLPPEDMAEPAVMALRPGMRVRAPFGHRQLVGILLALKTDTDIAIEQLKPATEVLDDNPILPASIMNLCQWAAQYYQHPLGDVLANATPVLLRKGEPWLYDSGWRLSTEGKGLPEGALKSAKRQAQLLALLQQHDSVASDQLKQAGITTAVAKTLCDKGLAERCQRPITLAVDGDIRPDQPPVLNGEQQQAVDAVIQSHGFQAFLLEGVTGSGKTEVYLRLIEHYLSQQKQALVLVPEIGLTPQTLQRFRRRFAVPIAILHSGLSDRERQIAWQAAREGQARIVIGTRSAIFTPLAQPGLIIVDEEHDSSYKQQDGFRYSARDLAVKRGLDAHCPVLLGSATPAIESLHNSLQGRYQRLALHQRATGAPAPRFELVDIRHQPLYDGLSEPATRAMRAQLQAGNQVLLFINRRGFAPVLMCHDCGWTGQCQHCDARLTVHYGQRQLRCHHCESQQPLPHHCPDCSSNQLLFQGVGTERCEQTLKQLFPDVPVQRIDRDTTQRKDALKELVAEVNRGEPCILVGTQMLAKGHHFPRVTLVVILDIDNGLFSADFRGAERMGQLLTQVAGRAGREQHPGSVVVQTHHPDHPWITQLIEQGYGAFSRQLLREREASGQPPYSHLALVRADSKSLGDAETLLQQLRQQLQPALAGARLVGPIPAPMTKRAGLFRAQLLLQASHRHQLHRAAAQLVHYAECLPLAKKLRWSIDIDPQDMF